MTQPVLHQPPAHWNVISVAIPATAFLIGVAVLATRSASNSAEAIGSVLRFAVVMAAFGALGETAAIAALHRNERLIGLSIAGVLLNLAVLIPGLYLIIRKLIYELE